MAGHCPGLLTALRIIRATHVAVKVVLGPLQAIVDDRDCKLTQRCVCLLFFLKRGIEQFYCPVYASLTGPSSLKRR